MAGAPGSKPPGSAMALAGVATLTIVAIVGIAGGILGLQCLGAGGCFASEPAPVAAVAEPAPGVESALEDNRATVAMTIGAASATPRQPDPAASNELIDATFKLLVTEVSVPAPAVAQSPAAVAAAEAAMGNELYEEGDGRGPPEPSLAASIMPLEARPIAARPAPPASEIAKPAAAASVAEAEASDAIRVGDSPANVRSGPSTADRRLFTLAAGTEVEASEVAKGWVHIAAAGGRDGWVDATLLENLDLTTLPEATLEPAATEPASASADSRTVTGAGVNVRSGPSKSSGKLFALAGGEQVRVIEDQRGWLRVTDDQGRTGWLYESYLTD